MHGKQSLITLGIVLTMISPVATATWMSYGSYEPDTAYDASGAFMYTDPPAAGEKKVYFNAWSALIDQTGSLAVNPNVGALETQNEVPNSEFHFAILGVWKDCNGDGYVGMAESALREYASELLLDTSICPPGSGSVNRWRETGEWHNYNGWVSELIPVAWPSNDARTYPDRDARVWGDFGRPDAAPTQRSCALTPQPRGTYQSTGGFLNYFDCRVDILGAMNLVNGQIGDPAGLAWSDTDDAMQDGHPLHRETFGSADSSHSAAHVSDCDADPVFSQEVDEVRTVEVFAPSPSVNADDPTTWTVPATYNMTQEELPAAFGDCDYSNDRGEDFYGGVMGEGDFNGVNPERKNEADWNFVYINDVRGAVPWSIRGGTAGMDAGNPNNQNVGGGITGNWPGAGHWESDSVWLSKTGFGIVKADLSGNVGLADGYYLTFYATVTEAVTSLGIQVPGSGIYGSWHCGSETTGIHNGWVCDASAWYVSPDGSPIPDEDGLLARPGQPYAARDVDCYDGSNALGVGVQPASAGPAPCV